MACNLQRDPEVEKAFWNEAKGMLASGIEPEEVIKNIAGKYGIGTDAVGGILTAKRGLFQLTNEAWAKQARLSELTGAAKRAVANADANPVVKALSAAYDSTRKLLTVGHGGVIPFTHAKTSFFLPGENAIFRRAVGRAYSYITKEAGSARWRADMATMRTNSNYNFWSRVGLDIKLQSQPQGMGMTRWTRQSFDALKPMRLELAEKYWRQLPPGMRTFEGAQDLAKRINHATGVVNSPPIVNKIAGATMFAPKLRFAKYASVTDAATSAFGAKRFAKVAAVNLGLLAVNDMVNRYILKNNQGVNWNDPTRADWLRMKIGGMTIPMAPLFETARLPIRLGAVAMDPRETNKWKVAGTEIASAAHPSINAAYGGLTGKDMATGRPLPFKGVEQYIYGEDRKPKNAIGGKEYAAGFSPIWVQPILKEMAKEGVFLPSGKSGAESILSGLMGTHAYPDAQYRPKKPLPQSP